MSIERNRVAIPQPSPSSTPPVVTESLQRNFNPSDETMQSMLGLHTVTAQHPEVDFITQKILEMGGSEGPAEFTNLLLKTIREAEHSSFHSGDKMKDVFTLLKLKETSGSVLNGWG